MLGRIPANRLYAPGLAILRAFPEPNVPNAAGYNYESQTAVQIDRREEIFRADWQASSAWRLYGRYFHNSNNAGAGVGPYGSFNLTGNLPGIEISDIRPPGLQRVGQRDRRAQPVAVRRGDLRHRPQLDLHPRQRGQVHPRQPGRVGAAAALSGRRAAGPAAVLPAVGPLRQPGQLQLEPVALHQLQHHLRPARQRHQGLGPAHLEGRALHAEEPEGPDVVHQPQRRDQLQRGHQQPVRHVLCRCQRRHRRVQQLHAGQRLLERRVPLLEHRVVRPGQLEGHTIA